MPGERFSLPNEGSLILGFVRPSSGSYSENSNTPKSALREL